MARLFQFTVPFVLSILPDSDKLSGEKPELHSCVFLVAIRKKPSFDSGHFGLALVSINIRLDRPTLPLPCGPQLGSQADVYTLWPTTYRQILWCMCLSGLCM